MPRYFKNKADAQALADTVVSDVRVRAVKVELVPYNGWVAVVFPRLIDLDDLADLGLEVRDGIRRVDPDRVRPEPLPDAPRKARKAEGEPEGGESGERDVRASPAPVKGATALVWKIADDMNATAADRAKVIAACEQAGVNPATAATQWSKWKKARGK
jgi:hypothetical protein